MKPKPVHEGELTPEKYAAVHRALLSGLLSSIGQRGEGFEYTGARGTKFAIFPGSGQFERRPAWVVSAELVRTTRLYARTVGAVEPRWIESAGAHLVQRAYTNARWQAQSGHVVADERVTLFGLVLVPVRRVHYGPIEPHSSRAIFIHHALVMGEWRNKGEYATHNQRLVERALTLEAKVRRRDIMADPARRFAFFNQRIPSDIHNGPAFERWRIEAEQTNPTLLFLSWEDVVNPEMDRVSETLYPDVLEAGSMRLEVGYVFDPQRDDDGATVTVPLAALNQVSRERLAWGIPGWLTLKIEALIRTLPKALRVNFVPAPQFAEQVASALTFGEGDFLSSVAWRLGNIGGVAVPPEAFAPGQVPSWLRLNVRVIDAEGKTVTMGRDLDAIRHALGVAARETFARLPTGPWHKDGLTRWDVPDLPVSVEVHREGMTLAGYPALVDAGKSVSMRLFDSPSSAAASHRAGVRRLFMLQVSKEMQYIVRSVRDMEALCLNYSTLGSCDHLKSMLAEASADRAFFEFGSAEGLRTREAFIAHAEGAWKRLNPIAREIVDVVRPALETYQQVLRLLDRATAPQWQPAVSDLRGQLALLMPKDFVSTTPWGWLRHYPRYLNGMLARLKKLLDFGLKKDHQQMAILSPLWRQFLERRKAVRALGVADPELELYRWMLEEFRVSLFAQELRTSVPVSVQRLEDQWGKVRVGVGKGEGGR